MSELCARCSKPIPPDREHPGYGRPRADGTKRTPPRRFCSDRCCAAQGKDDTQDLLKSVSEYTLCAWCHSLFFRTVVNRRFCTVACRDKWRKLQLIEKLSRARQLRAENQRHA